MTVDVEAMLQEFVSREASDLYLTVDAPPLMRLANTIIPYHSQKLTEADVLHILRHIVTPEIMEEFHATLEYNTAINWHNKARFRINIFRQQTLSGFDRQTIFL